MAPIILIMGAPASGKGTQAKILAQKLNGAAISSGELLRSSGDPAVKAILAAGQLAPSPVVSAAVEKAILAVPAGKTIVLDGFTRLLAEAEWLESAQPGGRAVKIVIWLKIGRDEALRRSLGRGRTDDSAAIFAARWDSFDKEVREVLEFYRQKGILAEVDGEGSVAEVADRVEDKVRNNSEEIRN